MEREGVRGVVAKILERVKDSPVYVSIDIDVLDPAFAPGTGASHTVTSYKMFSFDA